MTETANNRPMFTLAEYADSPAPYEYLWSLNGQDFLQVREKGRLAEHARSMGCKNFLSIWKAYVTTKESLKGRSLSVNVTEFSGQEKELQCGEYLCTDQGIKIFSAMGQSITVCPHPIMPTRRLINIDTGEVRVELAYRRGAVWRKAIFEKTQLASAQKIVSLSAYGIGVDSENARDLVRYLSYMENMNYDMLPEEQSVGRLGWVTDEIFSPYVEGVTYDGGEQYRHTFEAVKTCGSMDKWLELARAVRSGKSVVARAMLAASFASILVKPLSALPFMVHAWGGTGAGKTVGLMLAASVWANPSLGAYVRSFNGTAVANELQAAFCGSLPLLLDELQCIKSQKDFDDIIYMLCEGVNRARGAKSGGLQRVSTWKNVIITTGEQPITRQTSGGGAVNRVIEMDCKDEKLFEDPRAAVAIMAKNYGHAGPLVAEMLTDPVTGPESIKMLQVVQQAFYDQLSGKVTDKHALAASILLTGDVMAEQFVFGPDGLSLTVDDILPYLVTQDSADANLRAWDYILDTVAANPSRFTRKNDGTWQGECWGQVKDGKVYIIKSTFDRLMSDAGFSGSAFLSWAKRCGRIKTGEGRNMAVKKRLPGIDLPARCICLLADFAEYAAQEGYMQVDEPTPFA